MLFAVIIHRSIVYGSHATHHIEHFNMNTWANKIESGLNQNSFCMKTVLSFVLSGSDYAMSMIFALIIRNDSLGDESQWALFLFDIVIWCNETQFRSDSFSKLKNR